MSETSIKRATTRRAKSKTGPGTMPDVLDGADPQQQPISPKKVLKKSLSRVSLAGSEAGNAKGRRTSSKPRKNEQDVEAGPEQDNKVPASAKVPAAKARSPAEIEAEEKTCLVFQNAIDKIKCSITDKQIIFGKLQAELMRMLRVFEKLQTLGTASVVDSIEAEQNVRFFGIKIIFSYFLL